MNVKRTLIVALITTATMSPLARQKPSIGPGARVLVIALRDSRLLTLCPVASTDFIVQQASNKLVPLSPSMRGRKTVVKGGAVQGLPNNAQHIVIFDPTWMRNAGAIQALTVLPMPEAGPSGVTGASNIKTAGRPTEAPLELDRQALDHCCPVIASRDGCN